MLKEKYFLFSFFYFIFKNGKEIYYFFFVCVSSRVLCVCVCEREKDFGLRRTTKTREFKTRGNVHGCYVSPKALRRMHSRVMIMKSLALCVCFSLLYSSVSAVAAAAAAASTCISVFGGGVYFSGRLLLNEPVDLHSIDIETTSTDSVTRRLDSFFFYSLLLA